MSAASFQPDSSDVSPQGRRHESPSAGVLISLSFWMCLLLAVALFAMVVLSPKVVRGSRRAEEYAANQQRLVNLRHEIRYGEQLAHEIESNTAVSASTHGEWIAVEEALRYHRSPDETPVVRIPQDGSFRDRAIRKVAGSRFLQSAGLVSSAALLILAFAVLTERPVTDEGEQGRPMGPHRSSKGRLLPNRYAATAPSDESAG